MSTFTTKLSATAPDFDPLLPLKTELAQKRAELAILKATIQHLIKLALSEESISDPIEDYLAQKYEDRRLNDLVVTQQDIIDYIEREIREFEEWKETEEILRNTRVEFRREVEGERRDAVLAMRKKLAKGIQRRR